MFAPTLFPVADSRPRVCDYVLAPRLIEFAVAGPFDRYCWRSEPKPRLVPYLNAGNGEHCHKSSRVLGKNKRLIRRFGEVYLVGLILGILTESSESMVLGICVPFFRWMPRMALTLLLLMDDRKCFEEVRATRWPMGVRCTSCDSSNVAKRGFDGNPERSTAIPMQ